jgi:magnesium transporter
MIQKYHSGNLVWVDLFSPTIDEIRQIVNEYSIHPLVAHELNIPTLRPKVDLYDNFIYLILHFPSLRRNIDGGRGDQEVDFIIGKDFIITTRYEEVDALLSISKSFEVEAILDKGSKGEHAGFIFFAMLSKIYESILHQTERIKDKLSFVEDEIFKGKEREMVKKLSEVSRELLDFKRATSLHDEILESFEVASMKFFGEDFRFYLRSLVGEYSKVENAIRNMLEFMDELRETNNALLTTKQNQITQFLTVVAFISLPLSIITSWFQIGAKATPIVGTPNDFWIIAGGEIILAMILYVFFKMKKWL